MISVKGALMESKFNIVYTREEDWIVARCIEIDVVSQGKSMKSAERNIKEAIKLYLDSFGEPRRPMMKTKPVIKEITLTNHDKASSGIRKRAHQVSRKAGVRKSAAKGKPRVPAKTHA